MGPHSACARFVTVPELADNGYCSESNVNACAAAGIDPVIAMGREAHHPTLDERFAGPPPSSPKDPTPLEAMDHCLKTPEGKMAQSEANSNHWKVNRRAPAGPRGAGGAASPIQQPNLPRPKAPHTLQVHARMADNHSLRQAARGWQRWPCPNGCAQVSMRSRSHDGPAAV